MVQAVRYLLHDLAVGCPVFAGAFLVSMVAPPGGARVMERKIEYIGISIFIFIYVMTLLGALYVGVEQFLPLVFFSLVFFMSVFLLLLMIDRFEIPMAKLDVQVAASTLIATIFMLVFVAVPFAGGMVRAQLSTLSMPPTLQNLLNTLIFVSLAESFFKFVIVQSLRLAGLPWTPSILTAAGLFAVAHTYRYGFSFPAISYLFIMGVILLMLGRLPKLLGSDVELSIYPVAFAHTAHNLGISAASLFVWW